MTDKKSEFDRNQVTEMLLLAQSQPRTVIEFQKRGGKIYAMEITDHVDQLEELVNDSE